MYFSYICANLNIMIMRKILFFILLISTCANAQRVDNSGEPYDVFCSLRLVEGSKCVIGISENKQMYIVDKDNEAVRFETPAAVLTYMSKRGWSFVSHIEFMYWPSSLVMKKSVTKDDQAMENIYISDNPQKTKKEKAK